MRASVELRLVALAIVVPLTLGPGSGGLGGLARAAGVVNFIATDDVGPWFQCVGDGCVPASCARS